MILEGLKKNKIYCITYKDATYSYVDILKNNNAVPSDIISIGKIRRFNNYFIDIRLVWTLRNKTVRGVIIPTKAIIKIELLKENDL